MAEPKMSGPGHRCGIAFLVMSALLWVFVTACFLGEWDSVTAMTTLPQWGWSIVGLVGAAIAGRLVRIEARKWPKFLAVVWIVSATWFSDNLIALARGIAHGAQPSSRVPLGCLRLVTLNCASSAAAAREVMNFNPDVLLLQESPPVAALNEVRREWFGGTNWILVGLDCTIVSSLPLTGLNKREPVHFTSGILTLPDDGQLLLTNLRLTPPVGRVDLWNPATWRAYANDRRLRRRRTVIGGDFNAPARDGIYKLLHNYQDAHADAGRGWGGTAINTIPLFRPDQVWVKGLSVLSCYAVKTVHSDHRMIVTDLRLSDKK